MPNVTIIVPTCNRLARLKKVLAAIEGQTYPLDDMDVVVVSDGSTDGTDDYLRALRTPLHLTAHFQPNQGVAATRNRALQAATGKYVLFVDDDVVAAPDLVEQHMATHQREGEGAVVLGPYLVPPDAQQEPWVRWEFAVLGKQYADMVEGRWAPTARQFYTGNMSVAWHYIIEAGGFDPAFRRAEDVELGYRLAAMGLRFIFNPAAVGYHYAERSFKSWIEIPYAYGRNDVIFTREKGQAWLLPTIFREFHGRNLLVRWLARSCLDRRFLTAVAMKSLRAAMSIGDRAGNAALPRMACSGVFNLRHYQGISDAIGGRRIFFEQVARHRPGSSAQYSQEHTSVTAR
jgi:GT2 family glycosyltransferase